MIHSYSPAEKFTFARISLGVYLFIHFVYLIPYSTELFSSQGVFPLASSNLSYGYFPNFLTYFDQPTSVLLFVGSLILASFFLTLGIQRRALSILLWYGWACLYHRNNLIHNPSIPYIGWLLLACAVIPSGEGIFLPFTRIHKKWKIPNWDFPKIIKIGAWILLGLGYTLSGFDKLWNSPSWRNGEALHFVLQTPLARNGAATHLFLSLPSSIQAFFTTFVVFAELLFGPLVLWSRTRPFAWLIMTGIHLGILLTVDFADLTCGMLVFHLFVFEPNWIEKPKVPEKA